MDPNAGGLVRIPEYTLSLAFFIVPGVLISSFLFGRKLLRLPQKKALLWNVLILASVGFLLDLAFAKVFFTFPDPAQTLGIQVNEIPIEEFIFYVTGFWFILLLYVYCDEYFLRRYNQPDHVYAKFAGRIRMRLYLSLSWKLMIRVAWVIAALIAAKAYLNPAKDLLPGYALFLLIFAYIPYALFWRVTRHFVNRPALIFAITVTTLISVIWEVTLALPRGYWGYHPEPMLGVFLPAWHSIPFEALTVWVFSSLIVLSYEFTKIAVFRTVRGKP